MRKSDLMRENTCREGHSSEVQARDMIAIIRNGAANYGFLYGISTDFKKLKELRKYSFTACLPQLEIIQY